MNIQYNILRQVFSCLLLFHCFIFMVTSNSFAKTPNSNSPKMGDKEHTVILNIHYLQAKPGDTLWVAINNPLYPVPEVYNFGIFSTVNEKGWFKFFIHVHQSCGYFDIFATRTFTDKGFASNKRLLLDSYFWESGDSVTIRLSNKETYSGVYSRCSFSGRGSLKYRVRQLTDSLMANTILSPKPLFDKGFKYSDPHLAHNATALGMLDEYKGKLSDRSYYVLKANMIYDDPKGFKRNIFLYYKNNIKNASQSERNKFKSQLNKDLAASNQFSIPEQYLAISQNYLYYLFYKYQLLSEVNNDTNDATYDATSLFNQLSASLSGVIRDRVVIIFFLRGRNSPELVKLYKKAEDFIHEPDCKDILDTLLATAPQKVFPEFALPDINGNMVNFSTFRGKTVVIDFWFDGCEGCENLYHTVLAQAEKHYANDKKVAFVSINCDRTKDRWKKGIESGLYTSSTAINLTTGSFKHPLVIANNISSFPFVVLVDKDGTVKYFNSTNLYNYESLGAAINSVEK